MTELPETYDPESIESKWRERWQEMDVYSYEDTGATDYVIDTPPPYPTGNLHIGNALGWCYMDFAARYRRLQGEDVLFPQGWDCHGLPTEVKVEENHGIHRTEVPREEFRQLCIEHTEQQITAMRETMERLGFSQDWDHEYRTMDPAYWGETQRSIVRMAEAGYVYRDEHPVNWCPRCMTAIADAEVETEEDVPTTLYRIRFPGVDGEGDEKRDGDAGDGAGGEPIEIATTRPELLGACVAVAVHPDDERYADRWLLARCSRVAGEVAEEMDAYRFDAALRAIREFVWHDLADDYVELAKGRLYEGDPAERDAARAALFTAVSASLRLLAPFAPFLTEEAWHALPGTGGSVHASAWPDPGMADAENEAAGAIIADAASTVREWKSDRGMALNAPLDRVEVYPDDPVGPVDTKDLRRAVAAPVRIRDGDPDVELVPVAVDPDHATLGPEFRDRTEQVVAALESMDPGEVDDQRRAGDGIEVDLGDEVVVVPGAAVEIQKEHRSAGGERVAVLAGERSTILVYP